MKATSALTRCALGTGVLHACADAPWVLLLLVLIVLSAAGGFTHYYVRLPARKQAALRDLIRSFRDR